MTSETYTESVARLNARIEELEAEIDLLQREVTATYQAYDDMMRCKDEDIAELVEELNGYSKRESEGWMALCADAGKMLPEGVEWPRFEDDELVRFGDRYHGRIFDSQQMHDDTVSSIHFKQSGFTINGNTNRHVYAYGEPVKRPEPEALDAADTQESIDDDATIAPWEYCLKFGIEVEQGSDESTTIELMVGHLLKRQRELLGGEQPWRKRTN